MPFLPPNQQRQSTEGMHCSLNCLKTLITDNNTKWSLAVNELQTKEKRNSIAGINELHAFYVALYTMQ